MIPTSAFEPTVSGPQRGFGPRQQAPRTGVGAGEQARRTGPCAPEQARRTRFWSRLCCAVFLALVLVAPSATASTQDIVGFGARGPAMGGVTMASLASGGLMNCSGGNAQTGWSSVNLAMGPFLVLAGAALIWLAFRRDDEFA